MNKKLASSPWKWINLILVFQLIVGIASIYSVISANSRAKDAEIKMLDIQYKAKPTLFPTPKLSEREILVNKFYITVTSAWNDGNSIKELYIYDSLERPRTHVITYPKGTLLELTGESWRNKNVRVEVFPKEGILDLASVGHSSLRGAPPLLAQFVTVKEGDAVIHIIKKVSEEEWKNYTNH